MKKILLTLIAAVVILGGLAGAGYAGYRIGFAQGAISSGNAPFIGRSERMSPRYMPMMPNFDRDFGLRVQPYRTPTMGRGVFGFSWFTLIRLLWIIAVVTLIVWFVYWLFARSGWRITRQAGEDQTSQPRGTGN
ncbi:MAG: hypothetical protein L6Q26_05570 [Anaerolineales bacterium]|nr:hypothetical protein [Anaerolineales bacterium]NUQ85778.1 hypothetical protein [Anaerolineales bacterium]